MLDLRTGAATVDRVVHPGAALLARPGVAIEIELAEQRTGAIGDVEKAHVRVPCRCAFFADRDAVERLDDAEQAGEHADPRENTRGTSCSEKAWRAPCSFSAAYATSQASSVARPSSVVREFGELGVIALGEGLGPAGQIAQEREHFAGVLRHFRHQRELGEVRVAQERRRLAAQREDACDDRRVVPFRIRAEVGGARRIRAMQRRREARGRRHTSAPAGSTACAA